MAPVEDLEKLLRGNAGVEGGGLEPLVSEELLDVADVGAMAEKMGCEGVAQQVRVDSGDRGRDGVLADEDGEGHVRHTPGSFSISAKEQGSLFRIVEKLRANLSKVEIEGGGGLAGEGNDAVSLSFGIPNEKPSLLEVDVACVEPDALAPADSRSVEKLEKSAVSFPPPRARRRRFHQARGLALGQDASRKAREDGRAKLGGGTPKENASLDEKAKELTNALEVDRLGREAQRRKGAGEGDEMFLLNGARFTDTLFSKKGEEPGESQEKVTLGGRRRMPRSELLAKSERVSLELGFRLLTGREDAHGEPPFEGPRSRPGCSVRSSEGNGDREAPGCDGYRPAPGEGASPGCAGPYDR